MTASQDHQAKEIAVKCLSQGYYRMVLVGFEPSPCRSQLWCSHHSTTLPTNLQLWSLVGHNFFCTKSLSSSQGRDELSYTSDRVSDLI